MVLSAVQQAVVSVVLVLCVFVAMPRIFGGGGGRAGRSPRGGKAGPGHYDPRQHRRGSPQTVPQVHLNPGNSDSYTYQSIQQMRNAMEKEIKNERTKGNGRELAFTLMPLYALGVGVFAAYKFLKNEIEYVKEMDDSCRVIVLGKKTLKAEQDRRQHFHFHNQFHIISYVTKIQQLSKMKMKSHEESAFKKEKSTEDKAKETEHQLLELEQHLAQTEKMLNSLLTQLDPLSNCVNALACEQKDEIMTQLQSIRRLMKESGLDKSENKMEDASHICTEKLEDLIQSFAEHSQGKEMDDREDDSNEDFLEDVDNDDKIEEHELCDECEILQFEPDEIEDQEIIDEDAIESEEIGLRRRNR